MKISVEELKHINTKEYSDGYRIVYFYEDKYYVGEYCKTIEGFMIGFAECDPIITEDDIPIFVSNEDLLDRCLNSVPDSTGAAIYKLNGTCVASKTRKEKKSTL